MTGPMRAFCYRLAVASGLRYSEIASIKPESFDWKAPSVTVAACYTKNGQTADASPARRPGGRSGGLRGAARPDAPIFPLPDGQGSEMLRADLESAGIPYQDASGLVFDFHSLRCQMATLADAAGISPRVVQTMMRHSTARTDRPIHQAPSVDVEAASSLLPSLRPESDESEPMAMTGTNANVVPVRFAIQSATEATTYEFKSNAGRVVMEI